MRLLLENQLRGSKSIYQFTTFSRLSEVLLPVITEKRGVFSPRGVDSTHFCGTLRPLTHFSGKALVSISSDLARFLLKPLRSINVLK